MCILNFYMMNGFSGHGIQQAPAAGLAIAEQIVYGKYKNIDLTPFGYERYLQGLPLKEKNVV
eukprot:GSMAST32.ASY1.ANO1.981.1 assembled CDS